MPERDKAFSVSVIQVMNKNPAYGTGRLAIKHKVSDQKLSFFTESSRAKALNIKLR